MIRMGSGVIFHALGAHELEADLLGAEVGYGFSSVFVAGNIVMEVGFHIFEIECSMHVSNKINNIWEQPKSIQRCSISLSRMGIHEMLSWEKINQLPVFII